MPGDTAVLPDVLAQSARIAEEGGVDQLTVMDHWFQMEMAGDPAEPMLEAYTTLGYLAAITSRIRLAPLVTGVTYRYPGLLAKTVTTLDVLSHGRAVLGIGAAWYEREHDALGVPYPALKERFERLEEAVQIALQMWSDDDGSYEGTHYRLAATLNSPQATSRPHPPLMIGGRGEKKTLRIAAQYAQIVNLTTADPDEVVHLLDVLRRHCDTVGTDYDAIEKQVIASRIDPTSAEFLPTMRRLADAGIQLAVFGVQPQRQRESAERLVTEIVPALAAL